MVGFFGFSRASAAAWTLLAPWCCTAWGRGETASGSECTEEAVDEGAAGDPTGFAAMEDGLLLAGAAMFPCFWSM